MIMSIVGMQDVAMLNALEVLKPREADCNERVVQG